MDVKDYKKLVNNLKKNNGVTDLSFRKKMACKIYKGTSSYDKIISDWLDEKPKNKKIILRYGENPNQKAYLINNQKNSIFNYQISGKIIS